MDNSAHKVLVNAELSAVIYGDIKYAYINTRCTDRVRFI